MISYKVRGTTSVIFAVTISVFLMLLGFTSVGFAAAPVALPDAYAVAEDAALPVALVGVLANDTDADTFPVPPPFAIKVSDTAHGVLAWGPNDGSFIYTPNPDYYGPDSFTYKANDGTSDSNIVTVTITVNSVNDPPVGAADAYGVLPGSPPLILEDSVLTVAAPGVMANDIDIDGPAGLTASLQPAAPPPANGTVVLNPNGSFTYTPNANFNGVNTFQYRVFDGLVYSGPYLVTLTVTAVNDAPVAVTELYSVAEDVVLGPVAVGVLANDTDGGGALEPPAALTAVLVTNPVHGVLVFPNTGLFTYTPTANYFGPDSFTYKAYDGGLYSNIVTVTISVTPVNDPPVAVIDGIYVTNEDTPLIVPVTGVPYNGVLFNDTGGVPPVFPLPNGDGPNPLIAILVAPPPILGTVILNANGSFTYTPFLNTNGVDSFSYKVNDGAVDGNTVVVNLTVTAVNDLPVAVDDNGPPYVVAEDSGPTIFPAVPGILLNDTDVETALVLANLVTGPANGTITAWLGNGGFTYTPNLNFNGVDTFTYRANDGTANGNIATVSITVTPVPDPPVAVIDSYTINEDNPLIVAAPGVLSNDTDPDGAPPIVATLGAILPLNGTITVWGGNGSFTYVPNPNFFGIDIFSYIANDGVLPSAVPALVTITVNPVNDPPVVANDVYNVNEDTPLVVAPTGVLVNDADIDGPNPTLIVTLVTPPVNGTVVLNGNGSFRYDPPINPVGWNGVDTFTYKANDGLADNVLPNAIVTINVAAVNDPPVAVNDNYTTNEDVQLVVPVTGVPYNGVLFNDTDNTFGEGPTPPTTAFRITNPTNGTLVWNPANNGAFIYIPFPNYNGPDSFRYKANDGALDSYFATVNIIVNALPVAVNDNYSTDEDVPLAGAAPGVLTNDSDADGNPLTAIWLSGPTPAQGTLVLSGNGAFTFTPTLNFNGSATFTYMVNDGAGNSNVATVTITVNAVNDPPVAVSDSYSVNEDTPLAVVSPGLLTNDTDVETIPLTVAIKVTDPLHGTIIAWGGNGSFTYMPNLNWFGVDSFTYKANDGALDSNVATVSITVNAVNDPPVAVNDNYSTNKNTPIAVPTPTGVGVIANDYDVEASPLTAIWVSGPIPAQGTVVLNANGSFLYTPALNFIGIATFTYKVNDGLLDNLLPNATVTITVNNPPVAVNDNYITNEDIPLTVPVAGVLANDTDSDGPAPIAAIKVSDPSNGTVVLSGNGSFTYTPALNYNGTDSFTYKANDGAADSNVATVTITVNAVNDAPVAVNDSYSASQLSVGVPGVVAAPGVLANDTDVDSLVLTAIKVTNPSNGTVVLNADGSFAYTPNPGYSGPDSFTYKANDGALDSNIATVSLTIPPTFDNVIPGGSVPANAPMTFSVDIWSNITGAGLYYKKGGDTSFAASPIALVQSGITWSGSIPAIDVTVGGLFYYVDATTPVTHLYYPTGGASAPASILVHANGGVAYATTPAGSPNIWNMISPNGVPDNPNLIDIVGAGFDATWIAWRWDADQARWETPIGAPKPPNSTDEFTAGDSWFFAKDGNGNPNFAPFSLTSVDVSVPFAIQLKQGWNMVANPFSFPTAWCDTNIIIRYLGNEVSPTQAESNGWVDNRAIWWDPAVNHSVARYSYEDPPFSMMPTSGQWLYSAVAGAELVIKPIAQAPPPIGPEPPPVVAPKKDMTAWEVSLSLQSPVGSDSVTAAVGRATKTTSLHQIKSPGTPLAPYIAFTRDDQVGGASMLSSDVRSIDEELTWSIKATASSEVSLNWSLVNVPDDYMLSLEDQTGKVVNLRQDSAIHLGVGVHSFILKAEKKALIPKATKLLANYPNPFNPETWIPFELSKDTDVAIKIYSSSGQLVRSLELGHKMAGFYSSKDKAAHWDGKNEAGEHVSSGIYFYNIQAGDYKDIRKMVIMK